MSLEEDEDSGDGQEEQFKSRMSRMIEKQKEAIARARDPGLSPSERRKAGLDVALQMMGHPSFHDIDAALAEANKMPPEEAAEIRKAAMEAIAGNVRVMLCMTGGPWSPWRIAKNTSRGSRPPIDERSSARSRYIGRWT
jgi:hypothetical protein